MRGSPVSHTTAFAAAASVGPAAPIPASKMWLSALESTARLTVDPTRTLPALVDELAERFGEAPALLSDNECLSYHALAGRARQYARWALDQGIAMGDVVGLLMGNRAEYLPIWLGITRAGGTVALLNTNLRSPSLAHCFSIVEPKHIIVSTELADVLEKALPRATFETRIWVHGGDPARHEFMRIDVALRQCSPAPLEARERRHVTLKDRALYIYTSGTTGLPKAAAVSHYRVMQWSHWFAGMMQTSPHDRMYNSLPLYHAIGGVVAIGALLVNGGSVVIREKFSARHFWAEVVRFECTLFQYIGELCRYLVNSPPDPHEKHHRIRLCCGNGLRGDIWNAFKERFAIPQILEFYAATEGTFSLFNAEGKPGAIGRIPPFLKHRFPAALVRFDFERGELVRTAQGRCIRCGPDEVGEALGRITNDPSSPSSRFEGYSSAADSERKILRDVFEEGDAWFRTGDLMRQDSQGYFHFVDRVGDTFRWKGENVATTEVAEVIMTFPTVAEAVVYGVEIPGTDGRAGMASIVAEDGFDFAAFRRHLTDHLPHYARPVFLRLCSRLEATATFKQAKSGLMREGYDPALISDPLFFNDPHLSAFVPLDAAVCEQLRSGRIRP